MYQTSDAFMAQPVPEAGNRLYQPFDQEEGTARVSSHYDQDPQWFYSIIGGDWHTYSCSLCEPGLTMTEAQERKLDLLADKLELEPGMEVLDVGCGWGGPLVYLSKKYGIKGHGIALTPRQIEEARALAARCGAEATFEVMHWQDLPTERKYDRVYTDETIVHFPDLGAFFAKCHEVLRPGQLMVHKELHLSNSRYGELGPMSRFVNQIYGFTGNYIPLYRELKLLDESRFHLKNVVEIPMEYYRQTLDIWLKNMFEHRQELAAMKSEQDYRDFRAYLKTMRYLFTRTDIFGLHVVTSRRIDP